MIISFVLLSMKKVILSGMASILLLIILGVVFLSTNNSPTLRIASYSSTDPERPAVELNATTSNLGLMKVSEQKFADFKIRNSGKKPLQLSNISSSCGCTVGQVIYKGVKSPEFGMHTRSNYMIEIAPRSETVIRVTYRPYVMPVYGVVEREVYVKTNDPINSRLTFKVSANVK